MRHGWVIALLTCVCTVAITAPAQATFPGRNGALAYGPPIIHLQSNYFGTASIDGVWTDVSTPIDLPTNIAYSPDGRRIAFDAATTATKRAIYIGNADGTNVRQVGSSGLRYNPAWSPDGTKIAFVQDNGRAGSGDIYTMTTSGGSLTRLTTASTWDGMPDYAPDGSRIAYTCSSGGKAHLCQMTPSGGSKTVTTAGLGLPNVLRLSWSPTSLSLVFSTADASGLNRIYRIARQGTALRKLAMTDGLSGGPSWSPDRSRIAFERDAHNGSLELVHVNSVDGSDLRSIGGGEQNMRLDPSGWQALP